MDPTTVGPRKLACEEMADGQRREEPESFGLQGDLRIIDG